ncbi:hypothetical protein K458DRAFT_299825 [Lentithecium fluviatile CBS 122367]|uniref:Microbial-type PARG catalytic domain-containing protein n=1 Tax=Lentithecium fluviatile CBS 122367 TaxID=1168545 RepID=A0A6G1J5W2_9PLEO|nr:hypothetical protein K458DRAFT_299825 [Lentithecium fluviatile CBS 122367]
MQLRDVAAETIKVLPDILSQLPNFDASASSIHHLKDTAPLDPRDCPGFILPADDEKAGEKGTRIHILDQDTFDTALQLQPGTTINALTQSATPATPEVQDHATAPTNLPTKPLKPVAVLNLASEKHAGGGWKNGALAQEEALCFRSSLHLSLHSTYYPIPTLSCVYTPNVLLIRTAIVAGLRHPDAKDGRFAMEGERNTTKRKIRISLRVAARQGHTKVILGALGCGVFANPPEDVAQCFLEVLREDEFQGGWWEDVLFAVLDNARGDKGGKDGSGNFGMFYRALEGKIV